MGECFRIGERFDVFHGPAMHHIAHRKLHDLSALGAGNVGDLNNSRGYVPRRCVVPYLLAYLVRQSVVQRDAIAQAHDKPVAVCGEIAGDPQLTRLLLALGLTEFSLHPATLLEVRRTIRDSDLGQLASRRRKLLQARDRRGIERWIAGLQAP